MTKWEYKTVVRNRNFNHSYEAKDWDVDMTKQLAELGDQGWELVAIEPRCDRPAKMLSQDSFGATTSDLWVFKRARTN